MTKQTLKQYQMTDDELEEMAKILTFKLRTAPNGKTNHENLSTVFWVKLGAKYGFKPATASPAGLIDLRIFMAEPKVN